MKLNDELFLQLTVLLYLIKYYKGVKAGGAGYNLHYRNGKMYFANGHYGKAKSLNATPTLSRKAALDAFLAFNRIEKKQVADTVINLLVKEIAEASKSDTLAAVQLGCRICLESDHPNNNDVGYVNAHLGKLVMKEPRLMDLEGTFTTRYSGCQAADTDPVTGGHRFFDNRGWG